jgi:hypothetical protein
MNTIPSSLSKEEILKKVMKKYAFHRTEHLEDEMFHAEEVFEAMAEYAAQQLQPPGTSDAVEFLKFIHQYGLKQALNIEHAGKWVDGVGNYFTREELYEDFLEVKTKQSGEQREIIK